MADIVSFGFNRRQMVDPSRIPPGQFEVKDFPVLSAGPTPNVSQDDWELSIDGLVETPKTWKWAEFKALPQTHWKTDIHCVTRWSKLDTVWDGVSLDYLFEQVGVKSEATHILASCYGGYTTNLPIADITDGKSMVAYCFDGKPLAKEHGGLARLLVPHLYFWKSAKWLNRITLLDHDQPGFWENYGYNNHGDPWKEERYAGE
jgi:DMSO/TMAO reductase YedYZ molybdopterin-dependent catalytic subunit